MKRLFWLWPVLAVALVSNGAAWAAGGQSATEPAHDAAGVDQTRNETSDATVSAEEAARPPEEVDASESVEASDVEVVPKSVEQTESRAGQSPETARVWGIETSLVYPFVEIYYLLGSFAFWRHGEALFGIGVQRWSNDTTSGFEKLFPPGRAEAYTVLLGYRQFLWRGLHIEVLLFPAYNRWRSHVDRKTYSGLELWAEAHLGYKFRLEAFGIVLCAIPQVGLGTGIWKQTAWPGEDSLAGLDRFQFVPNVIIGAEF
jgi:hypothetical protein